MRVVKPSRRAKSLIRTVLLQRPGSPSAQMAALSRRLGRASTDLHISSSPDQSQKKSTLARKVQSELNLTQLNRVNTAKSIANSSTGSAFSGDSADLLPDEVPSSQGLNELSVDCYAIAALREVRRVLKSIASCCTNSQFYFAAWCSSCTTTRSECRHFCKRRDEATL